MKPERPAKPRIFTRRRLSLVAVMALVSAAAWLVFEARVAAAFETADRIVPDRVVARPLILRPGDRPSADAVEAYLERVGYRETDRRVPRTGEFRFRRDEWRVGRRAIRFGSFFDPGGSASIRLDRYGRIRSILDEDDRRLPGLVLDPEPLGVRLGPDARDRIPVRLDELPPHVTGALLSVEDRRFRDHAGFDPRRIGGALLANLRQGRLAEGGSTLTQQLARTLFLSTDRTVLRKVREALIAVALERRFSKDRILEAYLNHIYLGQDGGAAIHGFGRAARHFFGKDATDLTVGEAALLVGIIRGPSLYSPHRHPDRARARRDLVLRQMRDLGRIDEEAYDAELAVAPDIREEPDHPMDGRWFMDYAFRELEASGASPGEPRGVTVVTSMRPDLQAAAERAVRAGVRRIERIRPALAGREQPLQAALVAIDPWTGEILALVGGRSYGESQFDRASAARRQPGSAFKPIVALTALTPEDEGGPGFTLASILDDEPLRVETPAGPWTPSNADNEFHGAIALRAALEESRNVPFARLGMAVGPEKVVAMAKRLGIDSPLQPVPSLALGASEVSLLELTSAYAVLAAEGQRWPPHAVRSVLGPDGEAIWSGEAPPTRAAGAAEAYLVTSALRGVVDRGTGAGVRDAGYFGPVAAKSGTTNGSRDAWFVGYTPELAVGVWVGTDDGAPVGMSGSSAALPIFAEFLRTALGPDGDANFRMPDGVEWIDVEPATGLRAGWGCRGEPELFLVGTAPDDGCGAEWGGREWRLLRRLGIESRDELERLLRERSGERRRTRRPVRIGGGRQDR